MFVTAERDSTSPSIHSAVTVMPELSTIPTRRTLPVNVAALGMTLIVPKSLVKPASTANCFETIEAFVC